MQLFFTLAPDKDAIESHMKRACMLTGQDVLMIIRRIRLR
jgi:hypothetical protein